MSKTQPSGRVALPKQWRSNVHLKLKLCPREIATDEVQVHNNMNSRLSVHWPTQCHVKWSKVARKLQHPAQSEPIISNSLCPALTTSWYLKIVSIFLLTTHLKSSFCSIGIWAQKVVDLGLLLCAGLDLQHAGFVPMHYFYSEINELSQDWTKLFKQWAWLWLVTSFLESIEILIMNLISCKKKNPQRLLTSQNLQIFKIFWTQEPRQYRKVGITLSWSKLGCQQQLQSTRVRPAFMFACPTRPICAWALSQKLSHGLCSQNLLSSGIALGNDCHMSCRGSDSNWTSSHHDCAQKLGNNLGHALQWIESTVCRKRFSQNGCKWNSKSESHAATCIVWASLDFWLKDFWAICTEKSENDHLLCNWSTINHLLS